MAFKLNTDKLNHNKETDPSKIIRNLKRDDLFAYPRDVQDQVWSEWFTKRNKKNLVIKMNTGSGKTVVGLMILQSSLNEDKGPALYLCPNHQLKNQVIKTANKLGIKVTDDPTSFDYQSSSAICVVTIHKLINGFSVFGINRDINIGSMVIDDAHACLDIIEDQFTIKIPRSDSCGKELWEIFAERLKRQYSNKYIALKTQDPHEFALIPYWDWQDKLDLTYKVLLKHRDEDFLKYKWGLIKDCIKLCHCVCTHELFEISPFQIPIDRIPAIKKSERIVFMTATMSDDSILFSHFDVANFDKENIIFPKNNNDIGERLMLIPKVIDPNIDDEDIKKYCKEQSKLINVVVIVPSRKKANEWEDFCDYIITKDDIDESIEHLKSQKLTGLVVLINRYDGLDLPNSACSLLIIDGLPPISRAIDHIVYGYLEDFPYKLIQKIEQGMGRGVRSNLDFCPIILMGNSLTDVLYNKNAIKYFSPATKAQYDLSQEIMQQAKQENATYQEVIDLCLNRDDTWVELSKDRLNNILNSTSELSNKALVLRKIYNDSIAELDIQPSLLELQEIINNTDNEKEHSYLKQVLANYTHIIDPIKAQGIQLSAKRENYSLLTPLHGVNYTKIHSENIHQAQRCSEILLEYVSDPKKLIISLNEILNQLEFGDDISYKQFENSLAKAGKLIGFISDQPDKNINKGPDVLFNIEPSIYLIIECKNQATNERISKDYCGQLLNSVNWFKEAYKDIENKLNYTPIIIHPSYIFDYHASPSKEFRIITKTELEAFKRSLSSFITTIVNNFQEISDINNVNNYLKNANLNSSEFMKNYTRDFNIAAK